MIDHRGVEGSGYTITENASLQARNTFGVAAKARVLLEVSETAALPAALEYAAQGDAPLLVLGQGSNILFAGDWPGVVLCLATRGIEVTATTPDHVSLRVAAGENWNDLVHWSLAQGLCGLENLALIPGTVGAAPIQNIGAYGVEVREFITRVHAWDRHDCAPLILDASDCAFAYRDSLFKRHPDRYLVRAVELNFPRRPRLNLEYAGIGVELAAMGVGKPTPADVCEAVIRLRRRKLPDPARIGNAGSFFKNPLVEASVADDLRHRHPGLPVWTINADRAKLSAAWLIEACGLKGYRDGDAGMSEQHALVLVNHGHASGMQLLAVARHVMASVANRFGVALEPEPRIVGAS